MADVDLAVGIGRAVVQHEAGLAVVLGHQLVVNVLALKLLQHTRLTLGQRGAHGEVGLRQVDRLVIIQTHRFTIFLSVKIAAFSAETGPETNR